MPDKSAPLPPGRKRRPGGGRKPTGDSPYSFQILARDTKARASARAFPRGNLRRLPLETSNPALPFGLSQHPRAVALSGKQVGVIQRECQSRKVL